MVPLLAKLGDPTDCTVCGSDPVQLQVTVPPAAIVSTAVLLLPLWPLTNWMPGPAVTEPAGPPPPPPPPPPSPPPPPPPPPRPPPPPTPPPPHKHQPNHPPNRPPHTHVGSFSTSPAHSAGGFPPRVRRSA